MPEAMSADIFNLFMFVVPGFVTVWSFRYFTDSKKNFDFEYFALSVVWGLIILAVNEALATQAQIQKLLQNPYAVAITFSLIGFVWGWMGSAFSRSGWFRTAIIWLRARHF